MNNDTALLIIKIRDEFLIEELPSFVQNAIKRFRNNFFKFEPIEEDTACYLYFTFKVLYINVNDYILELVHYFDAHYIEIVLIEREIYT